MTVIARAETHVEGVVHAPQSFHSDGMREIA